MTREMKPVEKNMRLPKGTGTKRKSKVELMKPAKTNLISTEIKVTDKMVEDWVGNIKGVLHILWECGFIDENRLGRYCI